MGVVVCWMCFGMYIVLIGMEINAAIGYLQGQGFTDVRAVEGNPVEASQRTSLSPTTATSTRP